MLPFALPFALGLLAGAAVTAANPVLAATIARNVRPAARVVLKAAITGYSQARVLAAEAVEVVEDIYAEAADEVAKAVIVSPAPEAVRRTATRKRRRRKPFGPAR